MTDSFVTAHQLRRQLDMVRTHNKELLREAQRLHDMALNRYNGLCEDMGKIQDLVKEQQALITSQDNQIAGFCIWYEPDVMGKVLIDLLKYVYVSRSI